MILQSALEQVISPKKHVLTISTGGLRREFFPNLRNLSSHDLGMLESVSGNPNREKGRKLENLIFLHLRKKYSEIYYFDRKDKGEGDFITTNRSNIKEIIQVCYELTPDNLNRELNGLAEAMHFFNFNKAVIVTFDQKDKITYKDFDISVVPAHEFLTGL